MTLTDAGTVLGTATYISPEQTRGETATPASDVYSFGVVLYRMLSGRLPFESESPVELAAMHRDASPPDVRDIRPDVPRCACGNRDGSAREGPHSAASRRRGPGPRTYVRRVAARDRRADAAAACANGRRHTGHPIGAAATTTPQTVAARSRCDRRGLARRRRCARRRAPDERKLTGSRWAADDFPVDVGDQTDDCPSHLGVDRHFLTGDDDVTTADDGYLSVPGSKSLDHEEHVNGCDHDNADDDGPNDYVRDDDLRNDHHDLDSTGLALRSTLHGDPGDERRHSMLDGGIYPVRRLPGIGGDGGRGRASALPRALDPAALARHAAESAPLGVGRLAPTSPPLHRRVAALP